MIDVAPSAPPAPVFRVVVLACRDARLAVAGGGVLRLDGTLTCPPLLAGRVVAVHIEGDHVVAIVTAPGPDARPPAQIPAAAYAVAPPSGTADDADAVTVTIEVDAPARTPPADDVYLSTERSGWNAAEIRMDRIDVRRWRAQLRLHRGARLAFRITRGSLATIERNGSGAIPSPHVVTADGAAAARVVVEHWSDVD